MAIAHHVVFGAYGFWLPNDPRGSWSTFVGAWELFRFGKVTKTQATRSVAGVPHNAKSRIAAKRALKYPPVQLSELQVQAVSEGFEKAIAEGNYVIHACSILPEHVHLVIKRHDRRVGQIIGHLKTRAVQKVIKRRLWSKDGRPLWARGCWKVFLDEPEDVIRAFKYVENNPKRERQPKQQWSFTTQYNSNR
jgi:REP element-mobilizing transposase RayT